MNAKRRGVARRVLRQGWMRTEPPKGAVAEGAVGG